MTGRALAGAAFVDGVGSGAINASLTVLVAQRFGLVAVGLSVGLSALGRLSALGVSRWLEHHARSSAQLSAAYDGLVAAMVLAALGLLALAEVGPYWTVLVGVVVLTTLNTVTSALLLHRAPERVMHFGPTSMAGQAAGAAGAAWGLALGGTVGVVMIVFLVVSQWSQIILVGHRGFSPLHHEPVPWRELTVPGARALVLALCTYGPLGIYAALTRDVTSLIWVGPAMALYALGGLAAPRLDARLPVFRRWPSLCLLGAVSVGTWALAFNGPSLLLARLVAGATIFVAQGRLFQQAQEERPGLAVISATSVGLGLGAGLGAIGAGALAATVGVPVMGVVLAGVTVAVSGGVAVTGRVRGRIARVPAQG